MLTAKALPETSSRSPVSESQAVAHDASHELRLKFDALLPHVLPRFRRMAMRWLRNTEDAEDAVQDAMLSAFRHLAQFDGRSQMSTWLTSILRNTVWMHIRRRLRSQMSAFGGNSEEGQQAISETLADPRPTPEQVLEQRELREFLGKLRATLPRSQQMVLSLRLQHEFSIKEAAESLGAPEGTVKARLARGRANLAERFHEAMWSPRSALMGLCGKAKGKMASSRRRNEGRQQIAYVSVPILAEAIGREVGIGT